MTSMSTEETMALTAKLYGTTDAMVWAEEWCKIAREIEAADDGREVIDEGWMVGWFANAFAAAERAVVPTMPVTVQIDDKVLAYVNDSTAYIRENYTSSDKHQ